MDFEEIKNLKEYRVEFKHVMNDIENYIYHMIKSRKIQFRNFDNLIYEKTFSESKSEGNFKEKIIILKQLNSLSINDLLSEEIWPKVKFVLKRVVNDKEIIIVDEYLKLYEKLINMENIQELNNLFINFCQCLIENNKIKITVEKKDVSSMLYFNLNEPQNIIWMKKMKYLLKFQKMILLNYYKIPNESLRESIFILLKLLFVPYNNSMKNSYFIPIHILSLLDPKSEWIKLWINNALCLSFITEFFQQEENINNIISNVLCYYDNVYETNNVKVTRNNLLLSSVVNQGLIPVDYIRHIFFLQNLFILTKVSSTFNGNKLFPIIIKKSIENEHELKIKHHFNEKEDDFIMEYNNFLEIVFSLFYKNTCINYVQQIKHRNIACFSISDYLSEMFNANPHNCFFIQKIIENDNCKKSILQPLDFYEKLDMNEKRNFFSYYSFIGNILNQIIDKLSIIEFYNTFCYINNNICTQYKYDINYILYERSYKNIESKSETIYFDIIEKFIIHIIRDNYKDNIQYNNIISVYFNILKKMVSTSYGYMALKRYNILEKLLNIYKEEKDDSKKSIFLKCIIDYSASTRGLSDLILMNHDIKDSIIKYINLPNMNILYIINIFNEVTDTELMRNIYDFKFIKNIVNILHKTIYNESDKEISEISLDFLNNTFLYNVLSYQNIRSILSLEKMNSNNDSHNYLSNLIQLILQKSSMNNKINIKMILFLKILFQLSLDSILILESELDIRKLISNKLEYFNYSNEVKSLEGVLIDNIFNSIKIIGNNSRFSQNIINNNCNNASEISEYNNIIGSLDDGILDPSLWLNKAQIKYIEFLNKNPSPVNVISFASCHLLKIVNNIVKLNVHDKVPGWSKIQ
ncbi:hypothetical protein BCR36DRAFT_340345, partial [Piromyces finnis]